MGPSGRGLRESLHAAATRAAASSLGRTLTVVRCPGRRVMVYKSNTETTFVSEPEAPWLSVTVTRTVKLLGRTMTYVCPTLHEP